MTGIGHNKPPLIETALADFREAMADYQDRLDAFLKDMPARPVRSRQEAADAADVLRMVSEFLNDVYGKRTDTTRPYRDAIEAVGREQARFSGLLEKEAGVLHRKVERFRSDERRMVRRQQEEQAQAEAARRDALGLDVVVETSEPAGPAPIVGDLGGRVRDVVRKTFVVTDVQLVPLNILNSTKVTEAIISVAKDFAKHMAEIPGIRIETEQGVRVGR